MEATSTEEEINASRPTGSIIQIKAISIDLKFPKEMCSHFQHNFSIRGYAAEMRARNPKACNPFPSDDALSETPQGPAPLSKDVENAPDSCNVAAVDAEIDAVEAVVNTDTDVRDAGKSADVGDTQITGNENVVPEVIDGDTGNVLVLNEYQKAESSGLSRILPQEKMNSDNGEQRIAETTFSLGDSLQNIDSVAVPEPVDSVAPAPLEVEDKNNAMYDSDWSEENVPSSNLSRRKARKVRLLADLLGVNGSKKSDPVREGDSPTSSKLLGPAAEATPQSHDQILRDDVGRDYYDPHTKGKMPHLDGSSFQGTVASKSDVPRAKGDAEPAVKGSEIPSSGRLANAPSGVGLQISNKVDRLKRKHERNVSSSKKKSKPSQVHDAFPPNKPCEELPKSANLPNGDLKKCSMTSNMSISKSFSSPSVAGESMNSSQDYQSPRETDKNNVSQKALQIQNFTTVNDRSSGIGHVTLDRHPHRIGSIGSSGNQDSVETGIFLKKKKKKNFRFGEGGTPPASEQALLKNKQVLDLNERDTHNSSHVLAEGSFPMPKGRDFFRQCEQEKIYEAQGPSNLISEHRNHRDGKAVVQGSSDDIPMEIVLLMAKNQYERALGNDGSHLVTPRTFNTAGRFPEIQDTRFMEPPAIGYSSCVRSGMSIPTGNNRAEKGNSMDYSRIGRNHYNVGQGERRLSIFDTFPQNQQILSSGRQFPTTASIRTGPQRSEVVGPSMFPRAAVMPFGHGSVQNFSAPSPESSHKGKTISDIKADELKKTREAHSLFPKPGGFELNHKPRGPLDPYANENIPALQLLSLMDERSPGATFSGGMSRVLDNGLTPGYHLKSNSDGRTGFLNGSMFLHHNQVRESSGLGIGAHNAEECSGQRQRPFTLSGSLSLESQMHDKSREKLQIFGSASDVLHSGQTSYRGKYKQKAVDVYSDIVEAPKQHSAPDDSQRIIEMETENGQENIMPLRTLPLNGICSLNRNPADFSTPEAGNEFTIHGRDIKFRKRKNSRSGNSSVRVDGPKQQRNPKGRAGKEKAQNNEA